MNTENKHINYEVKVEDGYEPYFLLVDDDQFEDAVRFHCGIGNHIFRLFEGIGTNENGDPCSYEKTDEFINVIID